MAESGAKSAWVDTQNAAHFGCPKRSLDFTMEMIRITDVSDTLDFGVVYANGVLGLRCVVETLDRLYEKSKSRTCRPTTLSSS